MGIRRALRPLAVIGRIVLAVTTLLVVSSPAPVQAAFTWRPDDYNWDGLSDMLVMWDRDAGPGLAGCLNYYPANGSGSFYYGHPVSCGWEPYMDTLAAGGDLNNDGLGDLVAVSELDRCLYLWYGAGDGYFGKATRVGCGWVSFHKIVGPGDINRDGNEDLLAVRTDDCMYRWYGNGNGGFAQMELVGCGWEHLHWDLVAPGDLNRDGHPDLMTIDGRAVDGNCTLRWYGDGRGGFGAALSTGCGWLPYQYNLAGLHDMNGDGNGDLIALEHGTVLTAWYGVGNGGFTAFQHLTGPVWQNQRLVE